MDYRMKRRKKKLYHLLVYIAILLAAVNGKAQVDPGVEFDLQDFIDQKIGAGETNIVIPAGRYRVSANGSNYHLRFNNLNDITIVADSVEMICTETVQAIQITNCTNFRLQGIAVDYDPLPFTQGQIIDMSADKRILTAVFIDGYSTTVNGDKLEVYDSISGELSATTYYGVTYQVDTEKGEIVLTKPSNYQLADSHEKLGDIVVLGSQHTRYIPHGIVPSGCSGLVLENVKLYSGTTFGFFEQNCSGSQYINCSIDRRPLSSEVAERGVRRMRSINADGFHSKHATVGPKYTGCVARYMGDDSIAINGDYHVITGSDGNILTVVGKAGNVPNLKVGDMAELVSYNGERLEDALITEINQGSSLTSEEKQFLQNQTFYGGAANTYKAIRVWYVTLDRPVDLPMGSVIASANRIGNGFEVKNCIIGPNRSRGILVKASDGVISGNRLVGNRLDAIKLSPEYVWLEAGSGSNVTVSDNVISDCYSAAIAVSAYGGNGETAPAGAHKNINITGNSISGSTNPAIALTSIRGLLLENNTIEDTNNDLLVPWIMNYYGRNEDPSREIYMKNVVIEAEQVSIQEKASIQSLGIGIGNNPFTDQLRLELTHPMDVPYSVYNMLGMQVFSSTTAMGTVINTSNWNTGLYIFVIDGVAPVMLLKR